MAATGWRILRAALAHVALTFSLWRRTLALVFTAAPRPVIAMAVLMLLQAFLPVGTLWASRGVVNAAAQSIGLSGPATDAGTGLPLPSWIAIAVGLIVAQQLAAPLFRAAQQAAGDLMHLHIGGALIAAANRWRGLARFEDPAFANHLHIARGQGATDIIDLVSYGGQFVQELFTTVAMSVALWRLHPLAPVLVLLAHVPQALQENAFGQSMADAMVWQSEDERKLSSYAGTLMDAEPAKDVRLFGLGDFFRGLHGALYDRASDDVRRLRRRLMARMIPAQMLSGVSSALVYLFVVHRVLSGGASLGDLVLYGGVLVQLEGALAAIGFLLGFFAQYFTWLPSLFLVLDAGPDLPLPARPQPAPRPIRSGLVLEHVTFRYPGTTTAVLHDVSLKLGPGERLALVGRNGAGKTTLIKLLCRLYDPTDGRILLDGVDLRDYDLADLRRQIAAIFQDFVCYKLTVQENIGLGDVGQLNDLEQVARAAAKGPVTK